MRGGAIRGELAGGGDVHEALAAKGDAVAVVMVHAQTGLFVAVEVVEDEILIRLMPACTFEQRRIELVLLFIGGNSPVDQGVDGRGGGSGWPRRSCGRCNWALPC